jgi:hypothetical protein
VTEGVALPHTEGEPDTHTDRVKVEIPDEAAGEVVIVMVVLADGEPDIVAYKVLGSGEMEGVRLGDKEGDRDPDTLRVTLAISLVANGLIVTEMEGVRDGDGEGVAYNVDARGETEGVALPHTEGEPDTHTDRVKVEIPDEAAGEVVIVMVVLADGEPDRVAYRVLGSGEMEGVRLGDKEGDKDPDTLRVTLAISLVANGLIVTEMEGVKDGDVEGVA